MRILLTAIGSMSAECVIRNLKNSSNYVIGVDVYPREWHYETVLCDMFYQVPFAIQEVDYINTLLCLCKKEKVEFVIPLTDLEIDVLSRNRNKFIQERIILCMPEDGVLSIVRNKFLLHKKFEKDEVVSSIRTYKMDELNLEDINFLCVAKPYDGRSSEGLLTNLTKEQLLNIRGKEKYIVQEQMDGDVFTVDYCRSSYYEVDCAIPRMELLRTKNGAGLTVKMSTDYKLVQLVSYIGKQLGVNGCVNMEFILSNDQYYLIDVNPRFSAGVAFSNIMGYDMVNNHLNCFIGKMIDRQVKLRDGIVIKKYQEVVM